MRCPAFLVTVTDVAATLQALKANGVEIEPTSTGATFTVRHGIIEVKGSLEVNGNQITITITHRPFTLSCAAIQQYVRNKIAAQSI